MVKKIYRMTMIVLCLLLPIGAGAQDAHWTVNAYAYRYDMTAYVALYVNGTLATDYTGYEVAAFCGDECRGVAIDRTAGNGLETKTYGYLRIRSNVEQGETITFKVYDKATNETIDVADVTVEFKSQQVVGLPSSPLQLHVESFLMGDANGDGRITTFDVTKVVDYILTGNEEGLNKTAADMNGDGQITTFDVTQIVQLILNQ